MTIQVFPKGIFIREASEIPHPLKWEHSPIYHCVNTAVVGDSMKICPEIEAADGSLPLGVPFEFETDLFKGTALLRTKGVVCDNPKDTEKYFSNRNCKWQTVIQGTFKEPMKVSDVIWGSEFSRPFNTQRHPSFLLRAAETMFTSYSPYGSVNDLRSDKPRIMSCIGSMARSLRADKPGCEPDICDHNLQDNCVAFGGKFVNCNLNAKKRMKYLTARENGFTFDTHHVYTFEYYDHLYNPATNEGDICGLLQLNMASIYNAQPMNTTAKTCDGRYLWSFQLWHKDLALDGQDKIDSDNEAALTEEYDTDK